MAGLASRPRDAGGEREDRARQLRRREVRVRRHDLDLLQARREVLRQHRRPRRQARRLRAEVHLRRDAAAAVPDRVPRRPAAGALDRLGRAAEERGRAALVPSLSRREGRRTSDPLHWTRLEPELELHVRGLPLDQPAQGLRREPRTASRRPGRRSTSPAKPATAPARTTSRGRRRKATGSASTRPAKGSRVALDERRGVSWTIERRRPATRAQPAARDGARDRGLRPVPRAPRRRSRTSYVHGRAAASTRSRVVARSRTASTGPTARCATRSTTTARSCRAGCSRRA